MHKKYNMCVVFFMTVHLLIFLCSHQAPRNTVKQASQGELQLEINKGQDLFISHGVFRSE